ncbi:hypothetical protein B0H16DRAFT_1449329 [Mycena metata]|uniref:Uncharacterized protein n=1 Tax=Mycena metata TaxID=1033252 RepID=A0AAD7K395_9AGAR|nr:hypothetical protein B0H16DRAFT_1449329 [Mycena metata]
MAVRTQALATLCILSCALLVAPSAYIEKKGALGRRDGYDQGGGYNQNGGYDHNGGYDQNGGYGNNNGNGSDGGGGGGGGDGHGGQNASEIILEYPDPERFCADYLGFTEPYATTQTVNATEALTTTTETSTETVDLGTETDTSTSVDGTDIVTQTVATTTETDSFTSTTTTYEYTAPAPPGSRRRRHAAARKRMQAAQKRDILPPRLRQFDDAEISAACSDIAMPQTEYQTATTVTVDETETDTFTTTSFVGPTTTTTTVNVITTTYTQDTSTTLFTTLTATTTSTTAVPTATLCAESRRIAQIGIASDGGTVAVFTHLDANHCCLKCFGDIIVDGAIPNCGAWQYNSVDGICEIASGAMGTETRFGCTQVGRYIVTDGDWQKYQCSIPDLCSVSDCLKFSLRGLDIGEGVIDGTQL